MDQFSRNWYQNFANFSEMATSLSFLVLHPYPPTHAPTHAITHLWNDFLEIGMKILQIFWGWLLCGFFKFYTSTYPSIHAPTHAHTRTHTHTHAHTHTQFFKNHLLVVAFLGESIYLLIVVKFKKSPFMSNNILYFLTRVILEMTILSCWFHIY